VSSAQQAIDKRNRAFWDELCGSGLARELGITDITLESLARFDAAYMSYYPYLRRYLDALPVGGRDVLEIGLGFGTVGQILAAGGARYQGADIAAGPVAMMQDRLSWLGVQDVSSARQASALDLPWEAQRFDLVVSIGCLHHTGDLERSVTEVHRVLRPGGTAFVMLYNAHSFRQLVKVQLGRLRRGEEVRAMYDANSAGSGAPHTDFVTRVDARRLFAAFSSVSIEAQNFDPLPLRIRSRGVTIPRERLLGNVARIVGLDLYIRARK
jgi:SAM-dependent methyltransferase